MTTILRQAGEPLDVYKARVAAANPPEVAELEASIAKEQAELAAIAAGTDNLTPGAFTGGMADSTIAGT